ncbi:MAG: hypothetical protein ACK55Z_19335 [bacterium]
MISTLTPSLPTSIEDKPSEAADNLTVVSGFSCSVVHAGALVQLSPRFAALAQSSGYFLEPEIM